MRDELVEKLGAEVELVRGSGGVFDVRVDGRTLYSRKATGRFPGEGEVSELIRHSAP